MQIYIQIYRLLHMYVYFFLQNLLYPKSPDEFVLMNIKLIGDLKKKNRF